MCSTLMRRSISLLRARKTGWTPLVHSNEKRVGDTDHSDNFQQSKLNNEDASLSDSGNAIEW